MSEARVTYPALSTDEFEELDANSDGFLSLAELEAQIEEPSGCNLTAKLGESLGDVFLLGLSLLALVGFLGTGRRTV